MIRKAFATIALVTLGALGLAVPAAADTTVLTSTVHIVSTPDDGIPPWARDTLDRVTTLTDQGDGNWSVSIEDTGTFVVDASGLTGFMSGTAVWTVHGTPKATLPSGTDDRSDVDSKGTYTSLWPLTKDFFEADATITDGIHDWEWTYTICDQPRHETPDGVEAGGWSTDNVPTCSPSPKASASPKSPGGVGTGASSSSTAPVALPTTGAPTAWLAFGAGAVVLLGVVLLAVGRARRRDDAQ